VIGDVGGEFGHAARVTGGAYPQGLAREGDEPLVAAVHALGARKAVGQDAAPQVGPEATLDPGRWAEPDRVGLSGLGKERL
jgi:hypothetical protein